MRVLSFRTKTPLSTSTMKNFSSFRFLAIFFTIGATVLFLANSSGPAANNNFFTGAPSAGGGMESTCSTCHNSGSFGEPQLAITFSDENGDEANPTSYRPGQTYTVTVAVGHTMTAPAATGFQSQILDASNNVAGVMGSPGAGVQISSGPAGSGRQYAEHSTPNADSTFTFEWTAPEAGAGEVKMYVVGNLVNRAAGTSGDNGSTSPTILTFEEGTPVSTRNPGFSETRLFPNPADSPVSLSVRPDVAGDYTLRVLDIAGRELNRNSLRLTAGNETIAVPTASLQPGIYLVELSGENGRLLERLLVR